MLGDRENMEKYVQIRYIDIFCAVLCAFPSSSVSRWPEGGLGQELRVEDSSSWTFNLKPYPNTPLAFL